MKILFLALFLFCVLPDQKLNAQNEYQPLEQVSDWYVQVSGFLGSSYYWISHLRDTSLNGMDYRIIGNPETPNSGYYFILRENVEERKVYRYWPDLEDERLYYDFGLEVGGSALVYIGWQDVELTAQNLDTIQSVTGPRKRWYMSAPNGFGPNFYVVEGVGASPLNFETPLTISDPVYGTVCAFDQCDLLYSAATCPAPEYRAVESYLSVEICEGDCFGQFCEEGTFTENLISSKGCDSTVYITISVLPVIESNISAEICEGECYEQYCEEGTFTENYPSSLGCDSIVFITINVLPEDDSSCITSTLVVSAEIKAVFPNPSSGVFNVKWGRERAQYQILNNVGKNIESGLLDPGVQQIDLTSQPTGVYYLKVYFEGKVIFEKLVKNK
ncbi:MAG: T9SS type A sorting domain-containing protein [Saprospiraceae bacterium]|nr:T9SS type A sorting domain-containing protein [Saprospiraceae bacterium]